MLTTASTMFLSILAATNVLAAPTSTSTSTLERRVELSCTDNGGGYRPVGEAQACVDYLFKKGTEKCAVNGENVIFCSSGNTVIAGSNVGGQDSAASLCRDVAYGAQKIIDSCTTPEGYVGGYNAAGGNGALIVSINRG